MKLNDKVKRTRGIGVKPEPFCGFTKNCQKKHRMKLP